jgi:AcrR family transcriptional regulator
MTTDGRRASRAADARDRLLAAMLRCGLREGGSAVSLQAIAAEAGVSKALVLYHYHDKAALQAAAIHWLTDRVVQRERAALAASTGATVLEEYWRWLEGEMHTGELRVLLELAQERAAPARAAMEASAVARQAGAEQTVTRIFQLLELVPRLPSAMIASSELAFREGLVTWGAQRADRNPRVAFDIFWLSILSLAR